jgi:hypothetical protein
MPAAKVYLRRKSGSTAMSWKCTAVLAGKVYLSRKSERTSMPYFCEGGKIPTSLALTASRVSGLRGTKKPQPDYNPHIPENTAVGKGMKLKSESGHSKLSRVRRYNFSLGKKTG